MDPGLAWTLGALLAAAPLPGELQLEWTAPSQCPSREIVEQHIADALVDVANPVRAVTAEATIEAVLVEDTQGYQLDLRIATAGTVIERQLRAKECSVLAQTTGLVVGIALDADAPVAQITDTMEHPVAEPVTIEPLPGDDPSQPMSNASPAEPRFATAQPGRNTRAAVGFALRVAGSLDAGVLPGPGGGLSVAAGVFGDRWRASAYGVRSFRRREGFDDDTSAGATFRAWSGGARGCFVPHTGALEFPLCGGAELALIEASGFGAPEPLDVRSLWVGFTARGGLEWVPLPWLGVFAAVEGVVAARRPAFTAPTRPLLHRSTPLAIRALAGIALRLGGPERLR